MWKRRQVNGSVETPGLKSFIISVGSLISARSFVAISQILVLPILARQLTVEDFGLMGLAMTLVIFANTLSDGGMGRSLIRREDADEVEWSSVNWLMIGAGVACTVFVAGLSPLAARYFDSDRLVPLLLVMSVIPLFYALTAAPNAEIERRENYSGIAKVQVIATVAGIVFAVAGAFAGIGVWALVGQQVMLAAVRMVGIFMLSHFRPSFAFSTQGLRPHLIYARDTLASAFLTVIRQQLPIMMISRVLGQIPLGYFAMAQRFNRLPQFGLAGPMSSVIYVRMSKAQKSPEKLRDIYYAGMRLLSVLLIPSMTMVAVAGRPVFSVLLSPEWTPVAMLFALTIGGLVLEAIAIFFMQALFRAVSRTDLLLRTSIEGVIVRIVMVLIALQFSLEAVALSFTLWSLIMVPRNWQLGARLVPITLKGCLAQLIPSSLVAAAVAVTYLWIEHLTELPNVAYFLIAAALGVLGIALTVLIDRQKSKSALAVFRHTPQGLTPVTPAVGP
nr:lipopolysaccharide biosynthesis protein [Celeribacter sp. HF31]